MYQLLKGMQIVEGASFVAAPSCGLHFAQLGAEVIRLDPIGGGPDYNRWPLAPGGSSLYWEGLNKGKKSITIDLSLPEGRELVAELITAPGENRGIFLTNFPASGFLSYERLKPHREDLLLLRVMGRADGTPAVDYTINSAFGIPKMTGPTELGDRPINHVLPAWDLLAGAYGAFTLLAAERDRRLTGEGREIRIPLSDLAIATLSHLGQVAEVALSNADRARYGNDLFGAFGRDFLTRDGQRIMLVAITRRQWRALVEALDIGAEVAVVEARTGSSFDSEEGARFVHRKELNLIVERALAQYDLGQLAPIFAANGVCWGPYRTLKEALTADPDMSAGNPLLSMVGHNSGVSYLTAGAAATLSDRARGVPSTAPRLGEHTDEILEGFLGLSATQVAHLHDRGVVAGPAKRE